MIEIERGLTEYFADLLGLTVDVDIFRGGIPDDKVGAGVLVESDLTDNEPEQKHYACNFSYKSEDRDETLDIFQQVSDALPAFGILKNGIHFKEILKNGGGGLFKETDSGVVHYFYTLNLIVMTNG